MTSTIPPADRPAAYPTESARRMPGLWRVTLGELTLTHIPDAGAGANPTRFYPATVDDHWRTVAPGYLTQRGSLPMGCGALLVERGSRTVLVDAGHGRIEAVPEEFHHSIDHVQDLPSTLERLSVDPGDIDTVVFTHLHADHTGWARPDATDDGRSLFPHARWVLGPGEWATAARREPALAGGDDRVLTVDDGTEVVPGLRAWSLPGHTPGHTAWVLDTGDGREVVAFGDAMHAIAQVRHPDWEVLLDADRHRAERSRRRLLDRLGRPEVLGYGLHLADQQLGRVVDGEWEPETISRVASPAAKTATTGGGGR